MLFAYHRFWPLLHAGFGSFFASLVSLFGFLSLTLFYGFLAQGAIPFCFIFNLVSLVVFLVRCFTSFLPSWGVYFFWGQFCIFVLFHSLILVCFVVCFPLFIAVFCVIPVVSLLYRVHVVYAATFCVPRTILRSALTALYVQVFDVYMARWAGNL